MVWIRERALSGETLGGTFLNLGSSLTAEIAGRAGMDWVTIDLEHGSGNRGELLHQLQALEGTGTAPVVRVPWNDSPTFKRMLDLGPSGIMVPLVNNREEAELAVRSMRYPPEGCRGAATYNRACGFGLGFDRYFGEANNNLLTVAQIETAEALSNLEDIASVEGLDVLFVGPLDLSLSLGIPRQFDHPRIDEALLKVVSVARDKGKAPGILAGNKKMLDRFQERGFTFLACGSDGSAVAERFAEIAGYYRTFRDAQE
jgi:4-hydroxy-2-oxoheptanedioate aldolase